MSKYYQIQQKKKEDLVYSILDFSYPNMPQIIKLIEGTNVFEKRDNFFLLSDFYKQTHWLQYPKGTTEVYSYYENRKGLFPKQLFFGLQYIIIKYLEGEVVQEWMIKDAEETVKTSGFGFDYFNKIGARRIIDVHGGKLPLEIKAIPEGSLVNTSNVLFTIRNTDPELPYLTNFVEDILMQVYSSINTATLSYYISKLYSHYASITGADEINPFFLNDFGLRGASSIETAKRTGAGHLLNFMGSDNLPAAELLKEYYEAPNDILGSVFATEHSTMTIPGKQFEKDTVLRMLEIAPENSVISIVIDSWDAMNHVEKISCSQEVKDIVIKKNLKLVCRPDSGNPITMSLKVLQTLWNGWGGDINKEGYRVLNKHVGVIYGDGINYSSINDILKHLVDNKFCVSNIIVGMGGELLQNHNRDTYSTAIKCSFAIVEGMNINVKKDPITQTSKKSKSGKLKLHRLSSGNYITISSEDNSEASFTGYVDHLKTVFLNGELVKEYSYKDIKATLAYDKQDDQIDKNIIYSVSNSSKKETIFSEETNEVLLFINQNFLKLKELIG